LTGNNEPRRSTNMFEDVTIKEEVRYDIASHEVLLSFNSDYQAEMFLDWWHDWGVMSFSKFHDERRDDYAC
jgi:hypothetical protein